MNVIINHSRGNIITPPSHHLPVSSNVHKIDGKLTKKFQKLILKQERVRKSFIPNFGFSKPSLGIEKPSLGLDIRKAGKEVSHPRHHSTNKRLSNQRPSSSTESFQKRLHESPTSKAFQKQLHYQMNKLSTRC